MEQTIVVAGGCFWGVEAYCSRLKGVLATKVGYAQGHTDHPTYKEVCSGTTGYAEAVLITYDSEVMPLEKICEHLFRFIDPTVLNRQGNDVGTQYRTGIYYHDETEGKRLQDWIQKQQAVYTKPIVVECQPLTSFWEAEPYHQMYLEINPQGYCHVDFGLIKPEELK